VDYTALGIAIGSFLLTAGGIIVYVRVLQSAVTDLKNDIIQLRSETKEVDGNHEIRLNNHDIIFESLTVNQGYIIQGIDELKTDLKALKAEHDKQACVFNLKE
jgi:hypothetical protein